MEVLWGSRVEELFRSSLLDGWEIEEFVIGPADEYIEEKAHTENGDYQAKRLVIIL